MTRWWADAAGFPAVTAGRFLPDQPPRSGVRNSGRRVRGKAGEPLPGQERVAVFVAPDGLESLVLDQVGFAAEAELFQQVGRRAVPRVQAGEDAVQSQVPETQIDYAGRGFAPIALAREGRVDDVAELGLQRLLAGELEQHFADQLPVRLPLHGEVEAVLLFHHPRHYGFLELFPHFLLVGRIAIEETIDVGPRMKGRIGLKVRRREAAQGQAPRLPWKERTQELGLLQADHWPRQRRSISSKLVFIT